MFLHVKKILRFDIAITFSPILKYNLLVSLGIKACGLGVTVFLVHRYSIYFLYIYGFNYVIVYFFSYLFRLIQRINNLSDLI